MRIESLECFLSLAETLNYTEAAELQNMTQSALSKIILQIEDELGLILLERSRRGVRLTPAGLAFAAECRKTLDGYYSCVASARNASLGQSGRINMAIRIDMIESHAIDIIRAFAERNPGIQLDIRSMKNSDLVRALDKGQVECAVSTGNSRNENIKSVVLDRYGDCLVMNPDHPFASRKSISLKEARLEPFVGIARTFSIRGSDSLVSKCRQAGFSPNIVAESSSIPHLFANLASGPYITLLSENYKNHVDGRFVFVPLEEKFLTYCKFHWNTASENSCLKRFAEFVVKEFADYDE